MQFIDGAPKRRSEEDTSGGIERCLLKKFAIKKVQKMDLRNMSEGPVVLRPRNTVALFCCHNISSIDAVSRIAATLYSDGIRIVFVDVMQHYNRRFLVKLPNALHFLSEGLIKSVISPFLESLDEATTNGFIDSGCASLPKFLARRYSAPCLPEPCAKATIDINDQALIEQISTVPHLAGCVAVRFWQILNPTSIIKLRENGRFLWNLHGGLLPEYPGVWSVVYAALQRDAEYGWTLHELSENVDGGRKVSDCRISAEWKKRSVMEISLSPSAAAAKMISRCVGNTMRGELVINASDDNKSKKCFSNPNEKTLRSLQFGGMRLCDPGCYASLLAARFCGDSIDARADLEQRLVLAFDRAPQV